MDEFYNIAVTCDSPRHARGKVAQIATFCRDETGSWERTVVRRFRSWGRRADRVNSAGFQPEVTDMLGPDLYGPLYCKLCHLHREPPTEAQLEALAAQGESHISFAVLPIASM